MIFFERLKATVGDQGAYKTLRDEMGSFVDRVESLACLLEENKEREPNLTQVIDLLFTQCNLAEATIEEVERLATKEPAGAGDPAEAAA